MGQMKSLVDELIQKRCNGNEFLEASTKFKLLLKGIDADKITPDTPDDPTKIKQIHEVAAKFNIRL